MPPHLLTKPTLVNGLVTLTPRSQSINRNQLAMPPLVVPYLGFSTNYAQYSPYPQPNPKYPELSATLSRANRICVYADLLFAECTNDFNSDAVLDVPLASFNFLIEDLGFISLVSFEVPLQVPGVYRLMVRDVSTGVEQLAEERVLNPNPTLMFFYLWDGAVLSSDGSERVPVDLNKPYQLRVLFTPFVPEADAALGVQPTAFAVSNRPKPSAFATQRPLLPTLQVGSVMLHTACSNHWRCIDTQAHTCSTTLHYVAIACLLAPSEA